MNKIKHVIATHPDTGYDFVMIDDAGDLHWRKGDRDFFRLRDQLKKQKN
jgi:hypothetical protein